MIEKELAAAKAAFEKCSSPEEVEAAYNAAINNLLKVYGPYTEEVENGGDLIATAATERKAALKGYTGPDALQRYFNSIEAALDVFFEYVEGDGNEEPQPAPV